MIDPDAAALAEADIASRKATAKPTAPAKVGKLSADAALKKFRIAVGDEYFEEVTRQAEVSRIVSGRPEPSPADAEIQKYLKLVQQ